MKNAFCRCVQGSSCVVCMAGTHLYFGNRDGEVLDDPGSSRPKKANCALEYAYSRSFIVCVMAKSSKVSHHITTRRAAPTKRAGTDRYFWAWLTTRADQRDLFVPRLDSCGAHRPWTWFFSGFGASRWHAWNPRVAHFYFKSPMTAPGSLPSMICSFN